MPGFVVTIGSIVQCAHMGTAVLASDANPRVKVMGQPVVNISMPVTIAGCPYVTGPAPTPCVIGTWIPPTGAARVKSMGLPLVVQTSVGLVSATIPGPFKVTQAVQARVKAM